MFSELLAKRAAENNPIRVGIIGAGKFGGGLITQIMSMQGIKVCAVADINLDYVKQAYITNRIPPESIQVAYTIQGMNQIIQNGKHAITEEGLLVARTDLLDVVVEATGIPEVGARLAYETITHHKHLIMVNVEADVTVGPFLRRLADNAGVVYSLVDGDQPGVTMNIVEWARTLGLEIIAAGRGTVFYDGDRAGTPDTVPERFGFDEEMLKRRTINLKMFNSFRDGSKAQIEMCALANMTGLLPDVRGMHEPSVDIADIPQVFSLAEEGGILQQHGVVELANSIRPDGRTMLEDPLRMGVFVVIRTDHPFIQEDLHSYHLHSSDNGQNYLLYRPYHLVAVEAPISIVKAVLYGKATGSPLPKPVTEVITVAKRNLKCGELLDGSGGYTVNGLIEKVEITRQGGLLPLGLAYDAKLKQDVSQGTAITYDMVMLNQDSFVLKLRRLQDAVV